MSGGNGGGGGGPCGACKFLRRKCVDGCVFAQYFNAEEGTAHFTAVHKVFGASNASKLLMKVPATKRLDAAVTLCYEALSRVCDPVYGCVGHIFALQQQVVNLQSELAYAQAHLSALERLRPPTQPCHLQSHPPPETSALSSDVPVTNNNMSSLSSHLHHKTFQQEHGFSTTTTELTNFNSFRRMNEESELQALARQFISHLFDRS